MKLIDGGTIRSMERQMVEAGRIAVVFVPGTSGH